MKPLEPKYIPKLAEDIAKWTRTQGPFYWSIKGLTGTKFIAPPCLPPMVNTVGAYTVNPDTGKALAYPDRATLQSYEALASYYAETLETAKCFSVTREMTNLAVRTVMPKYKLTLDMLPKKALRGFVVWDMAISDAEAYDTVTVSRSFFSEEPDELQPQREFDRYADADVPVVAASWRYDPEAHSVWVAFYARNDDLREMQEKEHRLSPKQAAEFKKAWEPLSLEREQELPIGQSLNWCDADPAAGPRLAVTALADPGEHAAELRELVLERNEKARVLVSEMVKNLIATWMIMNWKIAAREELPPPQHIIRKLKKSGKSRDEIEREAGTTVISLGSPIRRKAPTSGGGGYTWKVRALVGPVIRVRQYIPAWGTYDEEPRFIEPFWAGPPDAPISNADKVFLLE